MTILKICSADEWRAAEAAGRFQGSPVDRKDGFIHFSTWDQVAETAARHYPEQDGLVLVSVDDDRLGDDLKWEESRGGDLFPHLYGDLDLTAVVAVDPLPLGTDGLHKFPDPPP